MRTLGGMVGVRVVEESSSCIRSFYLILSFIEDIPVLHPAGGSHHTNPLSYEFVSHREKGRTV